jgi:hypothetical protein
MTSSKYVLLLPKMVVYVKLKSNSVLLRLGEKLQPEWVVSFAGVRNIT